MNLKSTAILIRFTVRELLARRALQVLFLLFLLFVLSVPLWRHFAPETQAEFLAAMGTGIAGFFLLLISVMASSDLIPRDMEEARYGYFVTHPVGKADYLIGRALGLGIFLSLAFLALIFALKIFFLIQGWAYPISASFFLLLKYFILSSFLIGISCLVERFSAVFLGFAFYFFVNSLSTLSLLAEESGNRMFLFWMKTAGNLLPHLELLEPGAGGLTLPFALKALVYSLWFVVMYLGLAYFVLKRRAG